MHALTAMIRNDMVPALGVTEPGAIAFCVAKARSLAKGALVHLNVAMNSGMYKNAFTCGIPNSEAVGNVFAAALGYVAGDPALGLEALAGVTPADNDAARALVAAGKVTVERSGFSSRIFIEATLETTEGTVVVTVRDRHTNIVRIAVDGETVFETDDAPGPEGEADAAQAGAVHDYTLDQLADYVRTVPAEEIAFVQEAFRVNLALFEEGLRSPRTTFARQLLAMNGGRVISGDAQATAALLCGGAIEARVIGLDRPAMSITGSGAHGIIATLPLYAFCAVRGLSDELLWRAAMLSFLVCTCIKEYSGRLSAFCGCAIAAGSGTACGLVYLMGGGTEQMGHALNNMASSITGMICDGGNQGCTMKGVAACDAAFRAAAFAMQGVYVDSVHGINGETPEETMRNMGRIAVPGMVGTEQTIVEIFEEKLARRPGQAQSAGPA